MTAAADHAEVTIDTTERIGLIGGLIRPIPVRAPLGDVAMHVEKAPRVRWCAPDLQRELRGLRLILRRQFFLREEAISHAGVVWPGVKSGRKGIAGVEQRCRARTAGKLPLRLRWQSIRFALLLRQPLAKRHRVVPTHLRDCIVLILTPMLRIKLPILPQGDLCRAQLKRLRDRHTMRRFLIPVGIIKLVRMLLHIVIRRRPLLPHRETAR